MAILVLHIGAFYAKAEPDRQEQSKENFRKAVSALITGNYDLSLLLFDSVLEERTEKHGSNSIPVANVLVNIGVIKSQLVLYDSAIDYYKRASAIYESNGKLYLKNLATTYQNIAICYMQIGDDENAKLYYENSDRLYQELNLKNNFEYESLLINRTIFYYEISSYDKAFEDNSRSFKILSDLKYEFRKWVSLGMIYMRLCNFEKSLDSFNRALIAGERDHGPDFSGKELILPNIAMAQLKLGDFNASIKTYKEALIFIEANFGKQSPVYANCLTELGQVYMKKSEAACNVGGFVIEKQKNTETALRYFQQALMAVAPGFNSEKWKDNPSLENVLDKAKLLSAIKSKAEALRILASLDQKNGLKAKSQEHLNLSMESFELATKVIHLIRTGFINQESRLKLAENEHPVYIGAVDVASKLFELTDERKYFEKAFEFSERSRSTDFQTMMRDSHARQLGGLPDSLLQKEKELKSEVAAYEGFIFEESSLPQPDTSKVSLWKDKVFVLKKSYDDLIVLLERDYPTYYQFKYSDAIVTVAEIQKKLHSREALVEYLIKDTQDGEPRELLTFMIKNNQYLLQRQPIDSVFNTTVSRFLSFLKNGAVTETRKKDFKQYVLDAMSLNEQLIKPVSDRLKDYRLVVVPDDILAYIPFDAFITQMPDTTKMDFRKLRYLIYDHSVSYTYSATLLYYYFNNSKKASKDLAAFAPDYNGAEVEVNTVRDIIPRDKLFPLPGAKQEVTGITRVINGDIFAGKDATEPRFKEIAGDYDILHLAMHTVMNDSLPMYSKLVFTAEQNNNGWLDTYEIYNLDLKARMAVLSACNTGSGRLQKGEGVMSLARAFLYSGCPSIVMTLWNIEDASSANIMIDFYQNLDNGLPKDEALRKAKFSHIQSADPLKAHPYYWLGYVSVGSQVPLFRTNYIYIVGMLLFIIAAIIFEKKFLRKRSGKHQL